LQLVYVPTLIPDKNENLDIDLICPPDESSYILIVVEESEKDPLQKAADEIGHLSTRFTTKKCVDVILWQVCCFCLLQ